jgi:hypothetical protein
VLKAYLAVLLGFSLLPLVLTDQPGRYSPEMGREP